MSELMIFIWVIGALFTCGFGYGSFIKYMGGRVIAAYKFAFIGLCLVFWPTLLGSLLSE